MEDLVGEQNAYVVQGQVRRDGHGEGLVLCRPRERAPVLDSQALGRHQERRVLGVAEEAALGLQDGRQRSRQVRVGEGIGSAQRDADGPRLDDPQVASADQDAVARLMDLAVFKIGGQAEGLGPGLVPPEADSRIGAAIDRDHGAGSIDIEPGRSHPRLCGVAVRLPGLAIEGSSQSVAQRQRAAGAGADHTDSRSVFCDGVRAVDRQVRDVAPELGTTHRDVGQFQAGLAVGVGREGDCDLQTCQVLAGETWRDVVGDRRRAGGFLRRGHGCLCGDGDRQRCQNAPDVDLHAATPRNLSPSRPAAVPPVRPEPVPPRPP